ncbi:Flp pilus assembly protein TadD, contains TPR repeats [Pseudomonas sp. NFACC23-1]|uniref:cellulose synthase subunit BcsC-related outer membrane protein n=1 Tax=unclassified Pseudomonas TaxID=196821 RepID=UPI000880194F|nr:MULTISPECIES: cellulose synthase subunit BcsC-related outer membrane protein [unclassified Pseudomonas]SDB11257.1 Flp pilus assembly protein TadD, contains TPR repeats [Pseudomonas sp. NFACC17-2]SEI89776.1 Flp pilus assembly protein TadD, contains TPR repeats [Pseudomonas sp. NFACC23-1]SFW16875.1 Flp pilus assembly protein TadD, contains TPR repeats [Pseudomonas sp. NFACC16-2]
MQKVTGWALLGCLCGPVLSQAATPVDQQQRFLEQMRTGEALYREDLVRDALARLNLIAPDQPRVLVAGIRQALLQQDQPLAARLLATLQRQAPDSAELLQARSLFTLQSAIGQQGLHRARELAAAGKAQEAVGMYRQLFGDAPPDLASAVEYWQARSGMPGQRAAAIDQLQALDRQYPGNIRLRLVLANLLFAQKKDAEGLAILHRLAGDPLASKDAAEQEYNYLSRLPISPNSVRGWQDFVAHYPDSPLKGKAFGQLQLQQQRLADPAWQAAAKRRQQGPKTVDHYSILLRQGDQALRRNELVKAEKAYQQARKIRPSDARASWALVRLYQAHSPDQLETFLDKLSPAQQREFQALRQSLALAGLKAQADVATRRSDWAQVNRLLLKARMLDGDDPWLAFHLAKAQQALGQTGAAEDTFRQLMQRQSNNPEARYAQALYLNANGRDSEALDALTQIPRSAWSQPMRDLAGQLQRRLLLARAKALRDAGQEAQAVTLLLQQPNSEDLVAVAGWALQRGDRAQAQTYYRQALQRDARNVEAQLGLIETLIADGQMQPAQQRLEQMVVAPTTTPDHLRRLANAWAAVGHPEKADALFAQLLNTPQSDPLIYRDGARLMARQQPQVALDQYARGMAAAGLLSPAQASPRDDRALTLASREKDTDDWLPRSLRQEVEDVYQQQNPTVHLYHDIAWRTDNTTPGTSDLLAQTSILRIDAPVAEGQGFVQAENVDLDAGRFDTDADSLHRERFGTCAIRLRNRATGELSPGGCPGETQRARGNTLAIGWHDERWALDIGHSAEGFPVANWLGGVSFASDWNSLNWKLTASRRPVSDSLLSHAGAVDPVSGVRWGGVTANGLRLDVSHATSAVDGVWASLGAHWLRGENVADNSRRSAMGGYYYNLIERANERLQTGLTLMYWGYDKDLSDFTLGQGGYYSPQHYYSLGVPLDYAWRNDDWSVRLEGSLGWAYATTQASELYPLEGAGANWLSHVQQAGFSAEDVSQVKAASSTSGANMRLQGLVERRLSDHLVLGGGLAWQHSEDYAPSRALLYLRYTFDPWQGNLPLPLEPISPYAQMR